MNIDVVDLTDPLPDPPTLDTEQRARVTALLTALPMLSSSTIGSRKAPEPEALIALAEWIITGQQDDLYPYLSGDFITLGPEIFVSTDGGVLCWKGRNYIPQPDPIGEEVTS